MKPFNVACQMTFSKPPSNLSHGCPHIDGQAIKIWYNYEECKTEEK